MDHLLSKETSSKPSGATEEMVKSTASTVFSSIHVSLGLFFDNRELEIKENYDSYTRSSEKVSC